MKDKAKKFDSIGPKEVKTAETVDLNVPDMSEPLPIIEIEKKPKRSFFTKKEKIEKIKPEKEVKNKIKKTEKKKKDIKQTEEVEKPKMKHKVLIFGSLGFVLFLIISVVAGAYAHQEIYKNKVFPGVVVWGEDVGGKSFDEVMKTLFLKANDQKIELVGPDQKYTASLADLGVSVGVEGMALDAYSKGRSSSFLSNYFERAKLLLNNLKYQPVRNILKNQNLEVLPEYTQDDVKTTAYLDKISDNIKITPQDSQVTISGGNINVVPAVFGREVEKDELKTAIKNEIKDFDNPVITIKTREVKPNIIDKAAEEVKVQSESVISRPVTLTYQGQTFKPNKETVASWISFTKTAGATNYSLYVDQVKMRKYFLFLESSINVAAVSKMVRVENGVKETVTREGKDGLAVDETVLGTKIATMLPAQAQVNLEIPTYAVKFKTDYDRVIVADWSKYIEINISAQTMTAYTQGGNVVGSWLVTTGATAKGYNTPVGTFLISSKAGEGGQPGPFGGGVCMPNPPSSTPLCGINYVSYFTNQGHAIHEAWWRTVFGVDPSWTGSHGCVNTPYDLAKWIYYWAPIGTPVIIHN